jgi:predicted Zn finger-like uncharacterized protein
MLIVCPACETTYDVPEQVLAPGRPLRCARCRSEWCPLPAAPPPASDDWVFRAPEPPPPEPEPEPDEKLPFFERLPPEPLHPPAADGPRVAVIAAWLVSILVLAGLCAAAITWRQPIERAWPPSVRAYALIGLQ